jgi:5-methylcytosine-specific restriction endonuclease McrA
MAGTGTRQARYARRRKLRMGRVEHDLTDAQWLALVEAWGGCAYCRSTDRRLQRDCVLAISRGGRYTLANVVPACDSCNASKCNLEVSTWIRRKRLDERAFLERQPVIVAELAERFAAAAQPATAADA